MNCRFCAEPLRHEVINLGTSPPSNAYLTATDLTAPETYFPLRVLVCKACWLVQTHDFAMPDELFSHDYGYFSSASSSWLRHCKKLVDVAISRFSLGEQSCVAEIAANDGYLLQFLRDAKVPCFGVEPTKSTAAAARARGLSIVEEFFGENLGRQLAQEGRAADFIVANNVLAHVPNINDFVAGFRELLKPHGVACFEFPHLCQMIEDIQFDTIYHEHFSYLSLSSVTAIFSANGLDVFDVEELTTHGGSLRVYAQLTSTGKNRVTSAVGRILSEENKRGVTSIDYYASLQNNAEKVKDEFLIYLLNAKNNGLKVAGYGAAAKGNTLLNYAGIGADLISFIVDRSPGKQDRYTPGSRIPIVHEDILRDEQPDRIVILPWNLREEITAQLSYARDWNARFVTAIPRVEEN